MQKEAGGIEKQNNIAIQEQHSFATKVWNIARQLDKKEADEAVLIKLAERLHNMRTIEFIDERKKAAKAKETIEIYMPLDRKINHQKLIDELNDLALKYNGQSENYSLQNGMGVL